MQNYKIRKVRFKFYDHYQLREQIKCERPLQKSDCVNRIEPQMRIVDNVSFPEKLFIITSFCFGLNFADRKDPVNYKRNLHIPTGILTIW